MNLRPASGPIRTPDSPGACAECAGREAALRRALDALAASRAREIRARRRAELYLRYLPEQAGSGIEPPLRHRAVDALNHALHAMPAVHSSLKRAFSWAAAVAARLRGGVA
jgi:hypothetical protein